MIWNFLFKKKLSPTRTFEHYVQKILKKYPDAQVSEGFIKWGNKDLVYYPDFKCSRLRKLKYGKLGKGYLFTNFKFYKGNS